MKQLLVSVMLLVSLFSLQVLANADGSGDTLKNKKDGHYYFTVVKDIEANEVQNQNRTATCWSFSALSFMESEVMRLGKGKHKLSEMYIVRMAYLDKAEKYVRMQGTINFAQGGAFHDIPHVIKNYGIVPQEVYQGLNYGTEDHNHSEMAAVLKAMCDAIIQNKQGTLTTAWKAAIEGVLDAYLGKVPSEFKYQGKKYTPTSFAESLGLNMDDYVTLTSYTHHPFYSNFMLEVADNWGGGVVYNLPLNEFMQSINNSLTNGYSVAWASDVSEKGFSFKNGLAIVPTDESALTQTGQDNKHFNDAGADRRGNQFDSPGPEKTITQEMRQEAFDNYATTDDHGMHITGMVKDQNGTVYYIVKNSWGTKNDCDGYMYASTAYVQFKTMDVMVHKDALPKNIKDKLKL
ncbi:MAG: aminopeptidase [Flavobacteriales bacterium]|nr:aminopeptidase [Flavobacteriales bacterium]